MVNEKNLIVSFEALLMIQHTIITTEALKLSALSLCDEIFSLFSGGRFWEVEKIFSFNAIHFFLIFHFAVIKRNG